MFFLPPQENIHTPAIAVDALFLKTSEYHFKTMHAHGYILFHLYVLVLVKNIELALFYACKLPLNFYIVLSFS